MPRVIRCKVFWIVSHTKKEKVIIIIIITLIIIFITTTVEPRYNEVLGDHENYLVISGFSLYQGKKTMKYKELGPGKLPCYKRVLLYLTSL